jgi:hypothetical protein
MSNPIDNNEFKHYLRFNSLNQTALYEICEPVGFDGASFVKEQIENRYARTIEYGAIDTIEFPDAFGKKLDAPRIVNQYGDTFGYMDYGFQWIKNLSDDNKINNSFFARWGSYRRSNRPDKDKKKSDELICLCGRPAFSFRR